VRRIELAEDRAGVAAARSFHDRAVELVGVVDAGVGTRATLDGTSRAPARVPVLPRRRVGDESLYVQAVVSFLRGREADGSDRSGRGP